MAPGRDREAVRPRPRFRQGALRRHPEDPHGAPDLSDRPFPWKGNGAERHGAAFCQWHLRADLERAHIDHVQITAVEPVGVERLGKFYERTGALGHGTQPPIPADGDDGDGAADFARRRCRPGEEGRGHSGDTPMSEAGALQNAVRSQYAAGPEVILRTGTGIGVAGARRVDRRARNSRRDRYRRARIPFRSQ